MAAEHTSNALVDVLERVGRATFHAIEVFGYWGVLVGQSAYWLVVGPKMRQPVRLGAIVAQAMDIGIHAIPIVAMLAATIGVMLAIQGIYTLRTFGAESRVVIGIALSVVREFSPLITGILIAGRSGSSLAARLGTMVINQEVDALQVMGISPARFLVAPALIAMMVMVPALALFADFIALLGAGLYVSLDLGLSLAAYFHQTVDILTLNDLWHGLGKSVIFAGLITLIGVANGAAVSGGAEGVGRATTRAVVQSISAIVVTDMLFAFVVTRV